MANLKVNFYVLAVLLVFLDTITLPPVLDAKCAAINEDLLKAAQYIAGRYDDRIGLVSESEDNGSNVPDDTPCYRTFWVYSDNLWASEALRPFCSDIAENISTSLNPYMEEYGNSLLFEAVLGRTIPTPIHVGRKLKVATYTFAGSNYTVWADRHKLEDGGVFYDAEEYADLCFYLSLNYYLSRDTIASEQWFRTGEAFWDGHGFLDKAAKTDENYQNSKLGLYLFTFRITGFASTIFNSVENRAWSYQKPENGGITALAYLNGTGYGTANVETTSALLLAYNEELIEKLTSRLKVGAYYYTWWNIPFNNHWEQGVKYTPFLDRYDSADNLTADKNILLAKQHKIDFFAVSWVGKGDWVDWADTPDHTWDFDEIDRNLNSGLLAATHMRSFRFCLFYETILVLENAALHGKNFTDIFINDMIYAAQNYFDHSSYLRVDGKPVLFVYHLPYLYQNSPVSVEELLNTTKKKLEEMGGVYLVGDVGSGPSPEDINLTWLYSMDAITSYHYHDSSRRWNEILGNASVNYPRWQSFLNSSGRHFIPNVYAGFDNTEHCEWRNCSSEGSVLPLNEIMFKEMLTLAINYSDSNPNIVMITSWNEWLESTAIEPSVEFGELFLHTAYDVVPEFSSVSFLLLFLPATAWVATVCRRKLRGRFSKT